MGISHDEILKGISVDHASPVPMQVQIKDYLAGLIDRGELAPGEQIPAVRQLAASCGVALRTAGLAVALLQREGRAVSHVGRGVFVRKPQAAPPRRVVYLCLKADILVKHLGARFRTLQGIVRKAAELDVELRLVTHEDEFRRHLPLGADSGVLFMDADYEHDGFGGVSEFVQSRQVPCCTANNRCPPHPGVDAQHELASVIATEHLLRLGHRRIVLANKPDTEPLTRKMMLHSGYVKALRRYGLVPDPSLVVEIPKSVGSPPPELAPALDRVLSLRPRPTSFVAESDETALHLLQLLTERGFRVPSDVSIVGHENMPATESSSPPLTTVDAKCPERGEKALEFILAKMDGRDMPEPKVYPELVVRGSTAPCAAVAALGGVAGSS